MMNIIEIDGCRAVIRYNAEQAIFYGVFVGLRSEVNFSAPDIEGLRQKGKLALSAFLDQCRVSGTKPLLEYSGELVLRIHPGLHAELAARAFAAGKNVNRWLAELIEQAVYEV